MQPLPGIIVDVIEIIMQYTQAIVTIAAVNFENLVNFYTQLLEQTPVNLIPNIYAEFQIAHLRLGIFKPKKNHVAEFSPNTQSQISLCLEVNNLEAAIAELASLGYPPPGAIITSNHGREIYAYDPHGNRLILHQSN
jgi:predicted enzyme related to lactoylglutathione lyase